MTRADALVIGLGSSGERHVRVLQGLGLTVATMSRRGQGEFSELATALSASGARYAVVANETAAHGETIEALARANFCGRVLVEKPLLAALSPIPPCGFSGSYVGYNLRFHPVLRRVRALLADNRPLSATAYVGQSLATWRPGRDHRATASASRASGGGVLRDLSHELDFLIWLFGSWLRVAALVQHSAVLGIETEDMAGVLLECARCPVVTLQLDYHHRPGKRALTVNTAAHTIEADLVAGRVSCDGEVSQHTIERDETYRAMHQAALTDGAGLCSFEEGLAVVGLVDAIERASGQRAWVGR